MSVTLHTDVGDIKIEIFCERTPKTCENFLALCASNYYNGCIFHRNIKGFMVQTGDPTGTGRGGNSIWGKKFEDEYSEYLKIKKLVKKKSELQLHIHVGILETTMSEVLYLWLIMAQIPMDLSFLLPMASSHIWT
ncbi:peptidyl-prolyl cis-trans isomerase-like 3 isoform X2 [Artibeus jamaicensis]|uniref:peptidyl-prolyl cis-trans isomerase-like 3 isoform X2 n=1 Tax=Artibeus jamaicensis TaxID=9417 RepID=UPI00235B1CF4|nr:peptidyl-prolyl cis-trans isomerase-like 3 isoform X2 [Artibeus jamaicensis]